MTPRPALPDVTAGRTPQDHIEILRGELRAVVDRLDACLAELARPRLTAVPTPATPAGPDPLEGLPPLIDVARAAAVLGLKRSAAYRHADAGDLPVRRIGGRLYIATAGLHALLDGDA